MRWYTKIDKIQVCMDIAHRIQAAHKCRHLRCLPQTRTTIPERNTFRILCHKHVARHLVFLLFACCLGICLLASGWLAVTMACASFAPWASWHHLGHVEHIAMPYFSVLWILKLWNQVSHHLGHVQLVSQSIFPFPSSQ